jgi:uncharacterized protein YbjT (DUF2867 family)
MDNAKKNNVIWRRCNGFSLLDVETATQDVDILIYLIHSMMPSSTLSQGSFSDFDLYLADNFARAARKNNIKKIIYLSGIIPPKEELSEHLRSRLEVEKVLAQYGNDLTVLRAGLIVGKNGSSFKILERLIKRLPLLICPTWTLSQTQPIDLEDVLASLVHCIRQYDRLKPVYDIAGPDIMTYREMLATTAKILGLNRPMVNVPFFSPGLSKLWVSKVTTTPTNLVYPLIESLKHEMIANKENQLILPDHKYWHFKDSLENSLCKEKDGLMRFIVNYNAIINFRLLESVSSLQRISCKTTSQGQDVARDYFSWLPKFFTPFIQVRLKEEGNEVEFWFFGMMKMLVLTKNSQRSTPDRVIYYITGGILARLENGNGRLEFRWIESSKCVITALLDYRPSLPWFIYKYTQALVHLFVMKRFAAHRRTIV